MKIDQFPEALVLGDDHYLAFFKDKEDNIVGAEDYHKREDGKMCSGSFMFDLPETHEWVGNNSTKRHYWTVLSWKPLSLSPSLVCTACGDHGWIREGKWVKV